jgi:hypothetical protein
MNALQKGLIFAGLQVALVSSLGAKLLWDRAHLPRAWAPVVGYDPNLIIRGRYVSVSLRVKADRAFRSAPPSDGGNAPAHWVPPQNVYLTAENGRVVANPTYAYTGFTVSRFETTNGEELATLSPPVAFFIPEHAADPTRRRADGEPWLEVTIPPKGPPRPIRFATKLAGTLLPLETK